MTRISFSDVCDSFCFAKLEIAAVGEKVAGSGIGPHMNGDTWSLR
jgi:hypothetical protein